jgi:hypothetical protein
MALRLLAAWSALVLGAPSLGAQSIERDLRRQCEGGEIRTCTVLGLVYETGAADGEPDLARALELYEQACGRGFAAGCTRLALAQQAPPAGPRGDGYVRVGHIADSETGEPIAEAVVEIRQIGLRLLTDEAGRVDLGELRRGRYTVIAGRLGYDRVQGVLPVPWDTDFLMLLPRTALGEDETLGGVFGRVVEEGTGRELSYVGVTLDGEEPIELLTGPDGRFSVGGLEAGPREITFSLIGYAPRTTSLVVQPGGTVEVHASLSTQAIELEPIEVVVGSGYLTRTGFYRRSRDAIGWQLTRRDLDDIDPIVASEILLRVPGVAVMQTRRGAVPITTRAGSVPGQAECRLRPYLDGIAMYDWDFDSLRLDDLEAIEVYHGPSAPIEYRGLMDPDGHYPCGVVLIWTTRGGRR